MIEIKDNARNRLTMHVDGMEVGLIDYMMHDDVATITHTEVYPEFNGRGYARFLVHTFLGVMELRRIKPGAICPYAIDYFTEHGVVNYGG